MTTGRSFAGILAAAVLIAMAGPAPAQYGGEVIDSRISAKRRAEREEAAKRQQEEQKKRQQQQQQQQKQQAAKATPTPAKTVAGGPPKPGATPAPPGAPPAPGPPVAGRPKPGAAKPGAAPSTVGQVREVSKALLEGARTRRVNYDEAEYSQKPGVVILNPRKFEAEKSLLERQEDRSGKSSSIAQPL